MFNQRLRANLFTGRFGGRIGGLIALIMFVGCANHPANSDLKEHPFPPRGFLHIQGRKLAQIESSAPLNKAPDHPVWFSTFPITGDETADKIQKRRRSSFEALFRDETDPYTGKRSEYSKCLLKSDDAGVNFVSGPPPKWRDCLSDQMKNRMTRRWTVCTDFVWELTSLSTELVYELSCQEP